MNIYLSNKMSGIPYFNAPWFDQAADQLMQMPWVEEVFNPAQKDRDRGFEPLDCPGGTFEEARAAGFELGDALTEDWTYIGRKADCVVVGPLWLKSVGAISEVACIQAMRKPAYEFEEFCYFSRLFYGGKESQLLQYALPPIMEIGPQRPSNWALGFEGDKY